MYRRLVAAAFAAQVTLVGVVHGQANDEALESAPRAQSGAEAPEKPTRQLLGAMLGLEAGGEVSPGGVRVGGSFIYRLTDVDWIDSGVGFTFGSGDPRCFRDRADDVVCDHGIASGFAAELTFAVRRDFSIRGRFQPFARGGLAIRVVGFSNDEVTGLAVPVLGSAGVRARVHPILSVVALVDVRVGWGVFNRGLGIEPHASFALTAGVEFDID